MLKWAKDLWQDIKDVRETRKLMSTQDLCRTHSSFKQICNEVSAIYNTSLTGKCETDSYRGDNLIVGAYSVSIDGVDLGSTIDGISINKRYNKYHITTKFRDLELDKMCLFFDLVRYSDNSAANFSGTKFNQPFSLVVDGPGPGCGSRNFYFPETLVLGIGDCGYNIKTQYPVELEVTFVSKGISITDCPDVIFKEDGLEHDLKISDGELSINNNKEEYNA